MDKITAEEAKKAAEMLRAYCKSKPKDCDGCVFNRHNRPMWKTSCMIWDCLPPESWELPPRTREISTCIVIKKNTNKEKTAYWVKDRGESRKHIEPVFRCSSCWGMAWGASELTNYCPNCGAKMEKKQGG